MKKTPLFKVPQHLAIIMDGNGRWARERGLTRLEGHQKGSEVARTILSAAGDLGISYLTMYTFSSENWRRDSAEVSGLMALLQKFLEDDVDDLMKNNVRFKMIGERDMLPNTILQLIENVEAATKSNTGITAISALSYGGRAEIKHAVKAIAEKVRDYRLNIEDISEQTVAEHLYTQDIPDPEILIRTSGEQRISNYLLWQMAYTEMFFVDKYWPDFGAEDLIKVLENYQDRERRFGTAA